MTLTFSKLRPAIFDGFYTTQKAKKSASWKGKANVTTVSVSLIYWKFSGYSKIIVFSYAFYSKIIFLKFGLSEKYTKFEKIFLMVLTNQLIYLINVKTMRKIFSNYLCFSKSPNFTNTIYICTWNLSFSK